MNVELLLLAIAILGVSGAPGALGKKHGVVAQVLSTLLMIAGSAMGLVLAAAFLVGDRTRLLDRAWLLPWGRFTIAVDPLAAVFLIPVFLIPALGAVYGQGYWKQLEHPDNARRLRFFYGLLAASMAMVVLSRDAILFLIAWEIMALSAYFVATADDEDPAVCKAGWVYLVATHVGTLCLVAMFALLRRATDSTSFVSIAPESLPAAKATAVFLLAVIGFGFKAGLMPLHVWLPGAHANAPSHVSAVMSGVMLKMGIYGIVRLSGLLSQPPAWWGGVLLGVGALSGVLGIAFALGQNDLKRTLAYSSIENIGIIAMGTGLALVGRSLGRADWIVLGLGGALLHVWNHSLFKSLLFLNAGAVIHAAGTRHIDRLGGLARKMPQTAMLFGLGAIAISALPPLNGFVSELLIYIGLFRTVGTGPGPSWPLAALAVPALALTGALAVACFVNLLGTVFLGHARSDAAHHAHDPSSAMGLPMMLLAAACIGVGGAPGLAAPLLERAVHAWAPSESFGAPTLASLAPFSWIPRMAGVLAAIGILAAILLRRSIRAEKAASAGTWDCGYARPSTRMEYSGSSFGQFLVGIFSWALWPKTYRPQVRGLFPGPTSFKSVVPDTVLDRALLPVFHVAGRYLPWSRVFQQGKIQSYVLYFLVILILLFIWGSNGP